VHRETKVTEVYNLAVGKGGRKLDRAVPVPRSLHSHLNMWGGTSPFSVV